MTRHDVEISTLETERDQLRAEVERLRGELEFEKAENDFGCGGVRSALRAATARAEAAEGRADGLYRGLCDAVRASGGVAKEGLSDAFLILGVPAEMAARRKAQEAAESTVAGLRRALEGFKKAWQAWPPSTDGLAHAVHFGNAMEAVDAALAANPDEHERRIKSEALREMARLFMATAKSDLSYHNRDLAARFCNAAASELEAANGR